LASWRSDELNADQRGQLKMEDHAGDAAAHLGG
jgi:hypothetical protein